MQRQAGPLWRNGADEWILTPTVVWFLGRVELFLVTRRALLLHRRALSMSPVYSHSIFVGGAWISFLRVLHKRGGQMRHPWWGRNRSSLKTGFPATCLALDPPTGASYRYSTRTSRAFPRSSSHQTAPRRVRLNTGPPTRSHWCQGILNCWQPRPIRARYGFENAESYSAGFSTLPFGRRPFALC